MENTIAIGHSIIANKQREVMLSIDELVKSVLITGSVGSGKTAGVIRQMTEQLIAMKDEKDDEEKYTQLSPSLLIFSVKGNDAGYVSALAEQHNKKCYILSTQNVQASARYNVLTSLLQGNFSDIFSYCEMFVELCIGIRENENTQSADSFWSESAKKLIYLSTLYRILFSATTAVDEADINNKSSIPSPIPTMSDAKITLRDIADTMRKLEDADGQTEIINNINNVIMSRVKTLSAMRVNLSNSKSKKQNNIDVEIANIKSYIKFSNILQDNIKSLINLLKTEKTGVCVSAEASRLMNPFLFSDKLQDIFCADGENENSFSFEDIVRNGDIVCLDMDTSVTSRLLGMLLKIDYFTACQRRIKTDFAAGSDIDRSALRPGFYICDEYQFFATVSNTEKSDEHFLALNRESRCGSILSTQHINSLFSQVGSAAGIIIQNIQTHIVLRQNADERLNSVLKSLGICDNDILAVPLLQEFEALLFKSTNRKTELVYLQPYFLQAECDVDEVETIVDIVEHRNGSTEIIKETDEQYTPLVVVQERTIELLKNNCYNIKAEVAARYDFFSELFADDIETRHKNGFCNYQINHSKNKKEIQDIIENIESACRKFDYPCLTVTSELIADFKNRNQQVWNMVRKSCLYNPIYFQNLLILVDSNYASDDTYLRSFYDNIASATNVHVRAQEFSSAKSWCYIKFKDASGKGTIGFIKPDVKKAKAKDGWHVASI